LLTDGTACQRCRRGSEPGRRQVKVLNDSCVPEYSGVWRRVVVGLRESLARSLADRGHVSLREPRVTRDIRSGNGINGLSSRVIGHCEEYMKNRIQSAIRGVRRADDRPDVGRQRFGAGRGPGKLIWDSQVPARPARRTRYLGDGGHSSVLEVEVSENRCYTGSQEPSTAHSTMTLRRRRAEVVTVSLGPDHRLSLSHQIIQFRGAARPQLLGTARVTGSAIPVGRITPIDIPGADHSRHLLTGNANAARVLCVVPSSRRTCI
jgi:hypothetical protein